MRYTFLLFCLAAIGLVMTSSCKKSAEEVNAVSVDFLYTPDAANPNKISFTAKISGTYDLIQWTFDGGEVLKGSQSVSKVFALAGSYKVVLSAWRGLEEIKCEKVITIEKNLLNLDFSFQPAPQNANLISFSANIAGKYDKVVWDFGNGAAASDEISPSVTYPQAGTYKVKLSVWSQNLSFEVVKSVTISKNLVDLSIISEPVANDPYRFKFRSSVSGTYSGLKWEIKGKTVADKAEIDGYFPFKGTYRVVLTASSGGYNFTAEKSINIQTSDPDYAAKIPLVWSEDFDGTALNTLDWRVETNIHVNNELQTYTPSGNYSIANGMLTITCNKVNDDGAFGSYTSARLNTQGKRSFTYGRIEARLRLPKGKGTWPAFWMLGESIGAGTGWPKCGEMDIMEYVGYDPTWVQGSLHSAEFSGGSAKNGRFQLPVNNDEAEWHVYGVVWQPDKISFYVDDYTKPYYTYNAPSVKTEYNWPYDKPFFVLLNLAFGGDWGGAKGIDKSLVSMKYDIDWVRYYGE